MEVKENKTLSHQSWVSVLLHLSVPSSTKVVNKYSLAKCCMLRKTQPTIISALTHITYECEFS